MTSHLSLGGFHTPQPPRADICLSSGGFIINWDPTTTRGISGEEHTHGDLLLGYLLTRIRAWTSTCAYYLWDGSDMSED